MFRFIERDDLLNMFSPKRQVAQVLDLFLLFGSLYNYTITEDTSGKAFAETVARLSDNGELANILHLNDRQQ